MNAAAKKFVAFTRRFLAAVLRVEIQLEKFKLPFEKKDISALVVSYH